MASNARLSLDDIQGIILRGYGHLPEARFLLLKVRDPRKTRAWLGQLALTSAARAAMKEQAPGAFTNVAFTHSGLAALGLDEAILDNFPRPFVEGSDTNDRAQILGDLGDNAWQNWRWGSREKPVDLALMTYARTGPGLTQALASVATPMIEQGVLGLVGELDTRLLDGRKEHFGFRDGIAQPVVAGSGRPEPRGNTIAAGEILLGHDDGYGYRAHTPGGRDAQAFGFNGSYMVMRQLSQDVRAFWKYCDAEARALGMDAVTLASKMVGRWPSGGPLARHPSADPGPAAQDEDNFGYQGDADGTRCPFGAHVRRSNPRDWNLADKPEDSMRLANLHRMIRRGRAYGPAYGDGMSAKALVDKARQDHDDGIERGLHFICFNGNLERQFEFVQHHWCNNPKFGGLCSDPDPLIGRRRGKREGVADVATFTMQEPVVRTRVSGLPDFVRLRGSGYFFMPSISAVKKLARGA